MTKNEIIALIDSKIAGQGTMVDAGSALPAILKGILEIAVGGENVQSDWNEADNTKPDYIKNKPTIPAAQIQSDWNQTNVSAKDYIKNKPYVEVGEYDADTHEVTENEFYLAQTSLYAMESGYPLPRRDDMTKVATNTLKLDSSYGSEIEVGSVFGFATMAPDDTVASYQLYVFYQVASLSKRFQVYIEA